MVEVLLEGSTLNEGADDEEPLLADPVMQGKLKDHGSRYSEHFDNILYSFTKESTVSNKITTAGKEESLTSKTLLRREQNVQNEETCCTTIKQRMDMVVKK